MTEAPDARLMSDDVYDRLRALLRTGAYGPGARLPSEGALAQRFCVSRPVLRQALSRLRAEGHIVSRKGSGSFVREPVPPMPVISFGPLSNIPDMRSFLEYRCSVEGDMAAFAASRRAADEFADIMRWESAIQGEAAAGRPAIEEDIGFHGAIARASGNRFFVLTLAALAEQTRFGIRLIRELSARPLTERFAEVAREHAAISAAIGRGDADEARRAMTSHLSGGIRRLFGQ